MDRMQKLELMREQVPLTKHSYNKLPTARIMCHNQNSRVYFQFGHAWNSIHLLYFVEYTSKKSFLKTKHAFLVHNVSYILTVVDIFLFTICISNWLLKYIITTEQAALFFFAGWVFEAWCNKAIGICFGTLSALWGDVIQSCIIYCLHVCDWFFGLMLCPKIDLPCLWNLYFYSKSVLFNLMYFFTKLHVLKI